MNIHPLIVHFPIALLAVYAAFECLQFRRLREERAWFYVKMVLVVCGALGAFAALATGDIAQEVSRPSRAVVEMHESFATATTILFSILAGAYLIRLVRSVLGVRIETSPLRPLFRVLDAISTIILQPLATIPLAVTGLSALLVTGALGGLMVYGPQVDPFVAWVSKLLFPAGF